MSVIITGMDMPENCANCPLTYLDTGDDAYWGLNEYRCVKDNGLIDIHDKERLDDCPLKSVDGLIDKIEIEICSRNYYTRETDTRDKIIEIIKEYCGMEE